MVDNQKHLYEMFHKYVHDQCTAEEIVFLFKHFEVDDNETFLRKLIELELQQESVDNADTNHFDQNKRVYYKILKSIEDCDNTRIKKVSIRHMIFKIAATLVLMLSITFVLYRFYHAPSSSQTTEDLAHNNQQGMLLPGGDNAILTLQNGTHIVLNNLDKGASINESGMIITKTEDGQIVYKIDVNKIQDVDPNHKPNSIKVPRGGRYQIVLTDGTKVWLNSETEMTFPISFSDKDRVVMLRGEAYFEVASDKTKPFVVKTQKYDVEVLGTHFNVSAYPDEHQSRTTLMEGKVKIKNKNFETILQPGQQGDVGYASDKILVQSANIDKALAWKRGVFIFDGEELGEVMKQVGRWYNAEVVCSDNISSVVLSGVVSRDDSLEQLLAILKKVSGLNFEIKNNTIIVQSVNPKNMKEKT